MGTRNPPLSLSPNMENHRPSDTANLESPHCCREKLEVSRNYKVKFMCSYGGKIQFRAHDNRLSYIGGDTKILVVDRDIKFDFLLSKVTALCGCDTVSIKYQLPGEDLDTLVSVLNDDDLDHLMDEYDRLKFVSPVLPRLRIFIFPIQNPSDRSEAEEEKEKFAPTMPMDFLFGFDQANFEADKIQELDDEKDKSLIGSDSNQKEDLKIDEQRKKEESLSDGSRGFFPANTLNNEQQFYIIPAGAMMRPVTSAPTQGYYGPQTIPAGIYPNQPHQRYTQVAYDSIPGIQMIYPPPAAQYKGLAADMAPAGAFDVETGVKVAPRATQTSHLCD